MLPEPVDRQRRELLKGTMLPSTPFSIAVTVPGCTTRAPEIATGTVPGCTTRAPEIATGAPAAHHGGGFPGIPRGSVLCGSCPVAVIGQSFTVALWIRCSTVTSTAVSVAGADTAGEAQRVLLRDFP